MITEPCIDGLYNSANPNGRPRKKEVQGGKVKVHLHGRLGVITIPERLVIGNEKLEAGHEMQFYFSYIQVVEHPYDYDSSDMVPTHEITPCLLGGKITEVNDTAAKVDIMDNLGTIAVPRRWLFTPAKLKRGTGYRVLFQLHAGGRKAGYPG